ncbi:SDR family NAD(P)-dependent oxidoreductase [Methylobacterium brachiatum]|uniref:SDR family NAD(P)-dependent oxidoreductase n=1 Tax=Methylobacterium brachiatum TaxID=269660 RepID=A0ABV1R900_9HYPH
MTILVTGAAGFIGFHLCRRLVELGYNVAALDSFNNYYDTSLKDARAARLDLEYGVFVKKMDIADPDAMKSALRDSGAEVVVHLAAQAGVRYSIEQPFTYERSNLQGHLSVLEACRHAQKIKHLIYASSSSVYGERPASGFAFREDDPVDAPVSLYAATKRAGELMSYTYAHLYQIPQTGLRFFTVYGPWGRPDMAYFSFTRRILRGEPIELYGEGQMQRDFTYIDDVVSGVIKIIDCPPAAGKQRVLNIGASNPRSLQNFVDIIERNCAREAVRVIRSMQPGDVTATWADVSRLRALVDYTPSTTLEEGLEKFVDWYRSFYDDTGAIR